MKVPTGPYAGPTVGAACPTRASGALDQPLKAGSCLASAVLSPVPLHARCIRAVMRSGLGCILAGPLFYPLLLQTVHSPTGRRCWGSYRDNRSACFLRHLVRGGHVCREIFYVVSQKILLLCAAELAALGKAERARVVRRLLIYDREHGFSFAACLTLFSA